MKKLFSLGLLNLLVAYLSWTYLGRYQLPTLIIFYLITIWSISSFLTDKYNLKYRDGYLSYHLTPSIKAFVLMLLFLLLLIPFDLFYLYSYALFSIIILLTILDMIVRYVIFYLYSVEKRQALLEHKVFNTDFDNQKFLKLDASKNIYFNPTQFSDFIKIKLEIITDMLKENKVDMIPGKPDSVIVDNEQYQGKVSYNNMADIYYLNILLNNIRYIGKKLKCITSSMNSGGWLIIEYRPLDIIEDKIKHLPSGRFLYLIHFFFKRILPKTPVINKIYFSITKGRNRAISRTEIWGRLIYCGFEVTTEVPFEDYSIILARRTKTMSLNKPSYYPIVKLNRIGFNGKIIQVYKVRSMYPFSEYLQQKIFEEKGMSNTGHFNDDSRITVYGRIIRKLWIDELPQLYHWLKGDLKLVGIRAMSIHYFNIHSKEYQNKYIRVMPGLVPPIFDSSITGFDQIAKVEEDYLDSYVRNRIKTDWKYFFITLTDILFKGVRSG